MRNAVAILALALAAGCATTNTSYLAKVNDEPVTGAEVLRDFTRGHAALEKYLVSEKDTRKVLDKAIERRLMIQEAYRMGLQDAPPVRSGVAAFRARKMADLLVREEVDQKSVATPEELRAAYAAMAQGSIVRHVVVGTREEAEALRARLLAGADLAEIVRTSSIAPSARRGGVIPVEWGSEDPARERAVAPLAEGALSEVYQSESGWEVARVEKRLIRKPEELPSFEEVEDRLRSVVSGRKHQQRETEFYARVWEKHGAKMTPDCAPKITVLQAARRAPNPATCATWNGGKLTVSDVAAKVDLDRLEEAGESNYPAFVQYLVDDLVNREVLALEAESRGLGQRPELVAPLRARQDELVERYLYDEYVMKGVAVTDDEVKREYEAKRATFMSGSEYSVQQIVVATEDGARDVAAKLGTASFEELAKAHSIDPRAAEGGNVGKIPKEKLVDDFAPVAALAPGQVSAPIKSAMGFHLVKVVRIDPPRQQEYDEVKDAVRERMLEERRRAAIARWVEPIHKAAHVSINRAGIKAFTAEQRRLLAESDAQKAADAKRKEEAIAKRKAARDAADADKAKAAATPAAGDAPTATPAAAAGGAPAHPPKAPAAATKGAPPAPSPAPERR